MTTSLERARLAAEQFIIRLRPGDQARVGTFNDKVIISDTFTGNRDALLRTLRENDRFANPTRLFDAIDEAMTLLEPLGGRRVVVVMTDGCDTGSQTSWDTLRRRFMSEEQMLYMVQFRPRIRPEPAAPHLRLRSPRGLGAQDRHPAERVLEAERRARGPHAGAGARPDVRRDRRRPRPPADEDDVGATFTRISDELHYLYLLGFVPEKRDGKTHDLTVRVADQTMRVRARRSYLSPLPAIPKLQPASQSFTMKR